MSNVLTSFLVGVGFDTSKLDEGLRDVDRGMSQVKTTTLKTSAALVGAFGAVASSVVATANRVDGLSLKTANMRTSQQYIYNYGNALKMLGGDAGDALSAVTSIEGALNNLRLKGELGPLQDLALAGVDISKLTGSANAEDFLTALSAQLPGLDKSQRGAVQNALGLSDAALKSLVSGPAALDQAMQRAESLTGNIDGLVDNSRRLMEESAKFGLNMEGINNEIADKFLPSLVGVSTWVNTFISENRGAIGKGISYAADNAAATTTLGASATAALAGAGLSKIGLNTIGGAMTKTGAAGVTIAGAAVGSDILNKTLDNYIPGYGEFSRKFDQMIMDITGVERIITPMELLFGGLTPDAVKTTAPDMSAAREEERQANANAIANAVSNAPVNINQTLKVEIDGKALDAKIVDVTERTAYGTLDDISSTTAR